MERTTHRIAWQRLCRRFGAFLLREVGVREVDVLLLREVGVREVGAEGDGVRVPPRGPDRIFSLSSKGKYLSCPLVGASKFLILIMNFEDAQFVAPPH